MVEREGGENFHSSGTELLRSENVAFCEIFVLLYLFIAGMSSCLMCMVALQSPS